MVITIDGLSVNGKTTLAIRLAKYLGFKCFNTGAIYRCYALYMKQNDLNVINVDSFIEELSNIDVDFIDDRIIMNDLDVTNDIYTSEMSLYSTEIASTPQIKDVIRKYQKDFIQKNDTVMEGRDIATRIAPNADVKFYLYASREVRAKRMSLDKNMSYDESLVIIDRLDDMDINDGLFIKPENAIEIDTTDMSLDEVLNFMIDKIVNR